MENAIEQLLLIQESYTDAIVKLCSKKPTMQCDGTRVPQQYENVKDTGSHQMKPIAKSKASQALIDMSSMYSKIPISPLLFDNKNAPILD